MSAPGDFFCDLLFPRKCILCRKLLREGEQELCDACRSETESYQDEKKHIRFLESCTALWYYEGNVRRSILRFKFYGARCYARGYGRLLAAKLAQARFDVLTWVPVSRLRLLRRGYDQVELIARATADGLGVRAQRSLKKVRNARAQSRLGSRAARQGNVLGAFRVVAPEAVRGKRVLLLDDILTTGATASECARILLDAGAEAVLCATVASARHDTKEIR